MFAAPDALWLLALVPALLALVWWERRRRRERLAALGDVVLLGTLAEGVSEPRRLRLRLLGVLVYALVVIGLAGPRFGERTELLPRKGLDVVFAIDVSSSMRARDVRPDRLERTKAELSLLFDRLRSHRIGIVAFAGTAFVQCPLTDDVEAARLFLSALDPSVVPQGGTDLGAGLFTAKNLFEAEAEATPEVREAGRLLVVITDGEDHEGGIDEAARALKAAGVTVLVLGVGSRLGEPIPLLDANGSVIGYKRDKKGDTIMTRLSPAVLEELASKSGGVALEVMQHPDFGASEIEAAIGRLEKREREARIKRTRVDRSVWPLSAAFLLLLALVALPERAKARARRRTPFVPPALLALGILAGTLASSSAAFAQGLFSRTEPSLAEGEEALKRSLWDEAISRFRGAEAHGPDERAIVEYDVGRVLYEKGLAEQERSKQAGEGDEAAGAKLLAEAAEAFRRSYGTAHDDKIRSQAALAEGNALARAGELQKSIDAYRRSLVASPENERARKNLATVLRVLQQQQQQQRQEQQQDQQEQQQEQQDQQDEERQRNEQEQQQGGQGDENERQQEQENEPQQGEQQGDEKQQSSEPREDAQGQQGQQDQQQPQPQEGDEQQQSPPPQQQGDEKQQRGHEQEQEPPQAGEKPEEQEPPTADGNERPSDEEPKGGEGQGGKPMNPKQEDAKRLLDALRQRERPLNPLLMQPRRHMRTKPPEKDW